MKPLVISSRSTWSHAKLINKTPIRWRSISEISSRPSTSKGRIPSTAGKAIHQSERIWRSARIMLRSWVVIWVINPIKESKSTLMLILNLNVKRPKTGKTVITPCNRVKTQTVSAANNQARKSVRWRNQAAMTCIEVISRPVASIPTMVISIMESGVAILHHTVPGLWIQRCRIKWQSRKNKAQQPRRKRNKRSWIYPNKMVILKMALWEANATNKAVVKTRHKQRKIHRLASMNMELTGML